MVLQIKHASFVKGDFYNSGSFTSWKTEKSLGGSPCNRFKKITANIEYAISHQGVQRFVCRPLDDFGPTYLVFGAIIT